MNRGRFIGVDGGGTKTRFVLINNTGAILAEHVGGSSYHLQVGLTGVSEVLSEGFEALARAAPNLVDDLAHVFIGLPAFGEDATVDPQLAALPAAILGHRRYTCGNDMICGWAGSLGGEDGINIVSGTGSIGYGERQGRTARAGGWGEVFGDEGSAYWVAIQGLAAFSKASDGRLERGSLYAAYRDHLNLVEDIDLCSRIMGEHAVSRQDIAALSPLVTEAALVGDPVALTICDRAGAELAAIALAIRRKLGFLSQEEAALSYSGGLLEKSTIVLDAFRRHLADDGGYRIQQPKYSASYGAALYALHLTQDASAETRPTS
jgi:N-acetylglucosamine kinase-like BadF-type ATPase